MLPTCVHSDVLQINALNRLVQILAGSLVATAPVFGMTNHP